MLVTGNLSSNLSGTTKFMRVWYNGRITAFQADDAGSIPATRSKLWGGRIMVILRSPKPSIGVRLPSALPMIGIIIALGL